MSQGFARPSAEPGPDKIDDASDAVTYLGYALPGSTADSATWRIRRITESGTQTTIEWADGDRAYDNVWDDRASLTYSLLT